MLSKDRLSLYDREQQSDEVVGNVEDDSWNACVGTLSVPTAIINNDPNSVRMCPKALNMPDIVELIQPDPRLHAMSYSKKTLCVMLLLATLVPLRGDADPLPVLRSKDIFGVYLGEETRDVGKRIVAAGIDLRHEREDKQGTIKDTPPASWFQGALNGSDTVKTTELAVVNSRIASVSIRFKDGSLEHYKSLEVALAETYGASNGDHFGSAWSSCSFSTTFEGQPVFIVLSYMHLANTSSEALNLTYRYSALLDLYKEQIRLKRFHSVKDVL